MFNSTKIRLLTALVFLGTMAAGSLSSRPVSSEDKTTRVLLMGTVRDFSDQHPDFERKGLNKASVDGISFSFGLDGEITTDELGDDSKPVYAGGSKSTTTEENFNQWYTDVAGVNQSKPYEILLEKTDQGVYRYQNTSFFPINDQLIGNEGRSKNYHFTFEIANRFTYEGGEVFNFSGDDDVWVYINGKKVIDIGGVHSRKDASVQLDLVADEIGLEIGETYDFNFFFAERHTSASNFIIETTLELESEDFAD
ncbi:MAG: fibro-slime domain-containing protein [Cyanobacteria bacterium J06621_8]